VSYKVVFVNGDGVSQLKWSQHGAGGSAGHDLLGEDVINGHSLQLIDVDRDGHPDIFCAEMTKLNENSDHRQASMSPDLISEKPKI
jgi:hypothetical protein